MCLRCDPRTRHQNRNIYSSVFHSLAAVRLSQVAGSDLYLLLVPSNRRNQNTVQTISDVINMFSLIFFFLVLTGKWSYLYQQPVVQIILKFYLLNHHKLLISVDNVLIQKFVFVFLIFWLDFGFVNGYFFKDECGISLKKIRRRLHV